jgi:hypothetical protein
MKKIFILILLIITFGNVYSQKIDAAYVKALYAKYPVMKSNLCQDCNLWVNPFYKSIADLKRHMPICEYAVVTKEHRQAQEALYANNPKARSGVSAEWFLVDKDEDVRTVYKYANQQIAKPKSVYEVVYGHCGLSYVLAAWCEDGMLFSDCVDYNEGMEYQGQNIGTQIATEDTTRLLIGWDDPSHTKVNVVDKVEIWAGCYAGKDAKTYSYKGLTVTIPDVYWKILKFSNQTVCYWMPNLSTEVKSLLPKRHIKYEDLVKKLGFDPEKVLN